jgi:hypothetical protein
MYHVKHAAPQQSILCTNETLLETFPQSLHQVGIKSKSVVPAQAGTHDSVFISAAWIPAYAGMTG